MTRTKKITLDEFIKETHEDKKKPEEKPETQGLYDLPEGWKWIKLSEVLRENRQGINPQEFPDKKFFLVTMDCIEGNSGRLLKFIECSGKEIKSIKYKFNTNHILYGKLRPYLNKVYVPDREGICTTEFIPFLVEGAIREYIAFCLRRKETVNFAMNHITGTRQPRVILSDFLEFLIPLPPLKEQKRIVSHLEQLISRTEEAKRLRKIAEDETKKIMQVALKKVFSRVEEEEWEWLKLNRLVLIESGKRPKGGATETGVPSLGGEQLTPDGEVNWEKLRYIPEDFFDTMKKGKVKLGDVLVVKDGATTGKVAYVKSLPFKKVAVNEHVFILRSLDNYRLLNEYLFYILFSEIGQGQIQNLFHGAAQGGITQSNVKEILIPLSPLEKQKEIVSHLNKIRQIINSLTKLQQKTEEDIEKLVPVILEKAFRGEL
ncbi:MAG: restriction endonuclease subunit S [Nitrososphaeria archaeon]